MKITDITPIRENVTTAETSYTAFATGTFDNLKTSKAFTTGCALVASIHSEGTYGFYGYAALAIKGLDIAPSITGLVKFGPSEINYGGVPETETSDYYDNVTLTKTCDSKVYEIDYLTYGLNTYGIYSDECISNKGIPEAIPTACEITEDPVPDSNAQAAFTSTLKGYREGFFFKVTPATLKDLLIRFGPLITYSSDRYSNVYRLLVGWDAGKWVVVKASGDTYVLDKTENVETTGTFDGIVILDTDAILCKEITAETPKELCSCPSKDDKEAYDADPRTKDKKTGICAAGTMRAAWAVVVAVLAVPALSLFW